MLHEFGAAPFGPASLDQPQSTALDTWVEAVSWIPTATTAS